MNRINSLHKQYFVLIVLLLNSLNLTAQNFDNASMNIFEHIKLKIDTSENKIRKNEAISFFTTRVNLQSNIELRIKQASKRDLFDNNGRIISHQTYEQYYNGIKIEKSDIKFHYKDEILERVNGSYVRSLELNTKPLYNKHEALQNAISFLNAVAYFWEIPFLKKDGSEIIYDLKIPDLVISQDYLIDTNQLKLAYKFDVYAANPRSRNFVYIDALNGDVIRRKRLNMAASVDATATSRYYTSHTIKTKKLLFGDYYLKDDTRGDGLVTVNMESSTNINDMVNYLDADNNWTAGEYHNNDKDDAALDAHWGLMKTYDYFNSTYARDSYDDDGGTVWILMNHGDLTNNSEWNQGFLNIGEADGINWDPTTCVEIIAHEFAHGILETEVDLDYEKISGAIIEGLSNIWGAVVESYAVNPIGDDIWFSGELADLRTGKTGLISLKDPHYNDQPEYVGDSPYWLDPSTCTPSSNNDYCYVHTNSSIVNHWFYLITTGDYSGLDLTPLGISDAAEIVYETETEEMNSFTDTFEELRENTIDVTESIYGECSVEAETVTNAWYAVGVGNHYVPPITYIENTYIWNPLSYSGCEYEIDNVTVLSTSSLTIEHLHDVTIFTDFVVESGASLLIY